MKDHQNEGETKAYEDNKNKINSLIEFVADTTGESKDEIKFESEKLNNNNNQLKY